VARGRTLVEGSSGGSHDQPSPFVAPHGASGAVTSISLDPEAGGLFRVLAS
jgi:hypothetical protein